MVSVTGFSHNNSRNNNGRPGNYNNNSRPDGNQNRNDRNDRPNNNQRPGNNNNNYNNTNNRNPGGTNNKPQNHPNNQGSYCKEKRKNSNQCIRYENYNGAGKLPSRPPKL